MFELLEKLRAKPASTKKQIAFFVAFCFALVILGIWLTVVYPDFTHTKSQEDSVSKLVPSPTASFMDTVSNNLGEIWSDVGKIKDSVAFPTGPELYVATTTAK